MRAQTWLPASALAIVVAGCDFVEGDRRFVTDERGVPAFHGLVVEQGMTATVNTGPQQPVVLFGEENLLAELELNVRGGVLYAEYGTSILAHEAVQLTAQVPALARAEAHGGSRIVVRGVVPPGPLFEIRALGASTILVGGAGCERLRMELEDGSFSDARDLPAIDARVQFSGGSRGSVHAHGAVTGSLVEGSRLRVEGNPEVVEVAAGEQETVQVVLEGGT